MNNLRCSHWKRVSTYGSYLIVMSCMCTQRWENHGRACPPALTWWRRWQPCSRPHCTSSVSWQRTNSGLEIRAKWRWCIQTTSLQLENLRTSRWWPSAPTSSESPGNLLRRTSGTATSSGTTWATESTGKLHGGFFLEWLTTWRQIHFRNDLKGERVRKGEQCCLSQLERRVIYYRKWL